MSKIDIEEVAKRLGQSGAFGFKKCSEHHYQVLDEVGPVFDIWPGPGKFRKQGTGDRAIEGDITDLFDALVKTTPRLLKHNPKAKARSLVKGRAVKLEQFREDDVTIKELYYRVVGLKNLLEPAVGKELDTPEVQALIDDGVEVNVQLPK